MSIASFSSVMDAETPISKVGVFEMCVDTMRNSESTLLANSSKSIEAPDLLRRSIIS